MHYCHVHGCCSVTKCLSWTVFCALIKDASRVRRSTKPCEDDAVAFCQFFSPVRSSERVVMSSESGFQHLQESHADCDAEN